MDCLQETTLMMEEMASKYDAVSVAYSDGKDSRVVYDLCKRYFRTVTPFFMYFLPGLPIMEQAIRDAERRLKTKIVQYPHWALAKCLRNGVFCDPTWRNDDLPEYKLTDIYAIAMTDAKTRVVVTGAKASDSPWRRRFMASTQSFVFQPIAKWNKFSVLQYLKMRNIPLPTQIGSGNATGIDLDPKALLWLWDNSREDFDAIERFFPYIRAVVMRRQFYGTQDRAETPLTGRKTVVKGPTWGAQ
jgi:3'-phosphoadenosine 5'-phosphosulfate sulfotransferase (PAPS reductase)/FAD synthetase